MPIAILGAHGQLGREFLRHLGDALIPLDRAAVDLTNTRELQRVLEALRPTAVINCAAYTHVDRAEEEPEAAFAVNAWGVHNLAVICRDLDCTLMHFSTNYVFGADRSHNTPYLETDTPGPLSVYGTSKLAGESFVRSLCPRHFIVRTCGLYGAGANKRPNFVDAMLQQGGTGRPLHVVADQLCTPTAAWDLVRAASHLLASNNYGLYHVTNAGSCTWFEFAREIFAVLGQAVALKPIVTDEYPAAAQRPRYGVLDNVRWKRLGLPSLRPWQEALSYYLREHRRARAA